MCKVLKVSRNAYYNYLKKKDKISHEDILLESLIKEIFFSSRQTYGSRRIKAVLEKEYNKQVSRRRITKIMKLNNLTPKTKGSKKQKTTITKSTDKYADNLINREFKAQRPNEKYTSDITYFKVANKYMYFYAALDVYSRKITSSNLSDSLEAKEAVKILNQLKENRGDLRECIFHSDRGTQYASKTFKEKLEELGMIQSMSNKGNCYDNAIMESFFATMKAELGEEFESEYEAYLLINEYINWYNNVRLHSALGYKSPTEFEMEYFKSLCTK